MEVNRKKFLAALTAVKPGLASKEVIEQTTCFIFQDEKVFTYNDEIAVSHPLDIDIEGAVPSKELYNILSRKSVDLVDIEMDAGEIMITANKATAGIRIEGKTTIPIDELSDPGDWHELPKKFIEGIEFCLFSASTDMAKAKLTCLHLFDLYIESCDGSRISRYDLGEDEDAIPFPAPILVPANYISKLCPYNPTHCSVVKGWIHFKCENEVIFSCRVYTDEFPDMDKYLGLSGDKCKFPSGLLEIIAKAEVFISADFESDTVISVTIEDGWMTVRGEGDIGWYEEKARIRYTGEDFKFYIHPAHFSQILGHKADCVVGKTALEFIGNEFTHYLSLSAVK